MAGSTEYPLAANTGNITWIYDNTTTLYGNVTTSEYDELLKHFDGLFIHPHYYQYLEYVLNLPDIYFYLLGIYIAIVGIFGVMGNALVIYIFSTTKGLRSPPNLFVINLAISDLGFSAINGFPLMTISSFMKRWYFGEMTCTVYAMLGGLFGFNSIATLAFISMDRYYVIAYPFDAMRKCTKKRALIQIAIVWVWAMLLSFPPLFGFGRYIAEGVMVECSFDYISRDWPNFIFNYMMFFLGFILPVFIIIICYINIIRAVSNQAKQMRAKAEKLTGESKKTEKEKQQNIQLAKIAAITISLFIISWVPYAIFAVAGINGYVFMVTPTTTQIPVLFAKASAIWNPVLYALSHPKFRAVLEEKFPYLLFCQGKNIDKDDDKSDVTQTSKAGGGKMRRQDSDSSACSELSDSVTDVPDSRVSHQPSGKRRGRPVPTPASGPAPVRFQAQGQVQQDYSQNLAPNEGQPPIPASPNMSTVSGAEVNPRAMTRAANAIFSHLVTAYEGMRVLTTSGDGTGASRLEQAFTNPAFEGDRPSMMTPMQPPMSYYTVPPSGHPGLMPPYGDMRRHSNPEVYAIPMNGYSMTGPYPSGYYGPPTLHVEQEQTTPLGGPAQRRPQLMQSPHPSRQLPPNHKPPTVMSQHPPAQQKPPRPPLPQLQNNKPQPPTQPAQLPATTQNQTVEKEQPVSPKPMSPYPCQNTVENIESKPHNENENKQTIENNKVENNSDQSNNQSETVVDVNNQSSSNTEQCESKPENSTEEKTASDENTKTVSDENLPLPPADLLDESEDNENSGEYNIGENTNNNSNTGSPITSDSETMKADDDENVNMNINGVNDLKQKDCEIDEANTNKATSNNEKQNEIDGTDIIKENDNANNKTSGDSSQDGSDKPNPLIETSGVLENGTNEGIELEKVGDNEELGISAEQLDDGFV